jgi:adenylylsulfate kinase-like enzyme
MTTGPALEVLWLFGPPGVGKSVVGWAVYSRLLGLGRPGAFLDIDQLGICYPESPTDPDRHQLKADNLTAVATGFSEYGARGLVVAGVLDSQIGPRTGGDLAAKTTLYRLRAEPGELTRRLAARGASSPVIDVALREAEILDRTRFADAVLDTTERSIGQVVEEIAARLGRWPAGDSQPSTAGERAPVPGPALFLWGAQGVGKSTVGFRAYLDLLRSGVAAAYVDVDQIGFCGTGPSDHRLRARNLAAVWGRCRAAGAEALIAVGPVDTPSAARHYRAVLPEVTFCGLGAGRGELERRLLTRQGGGSWAQPGDPLRGLPVEELLRVADRAATEAASAEGAGAGAWIQTDGMTVAQSAQAALAAWSGRRG